jgi:hypothetical protein
VHLTIDRGSIEVELMNLTQDFNTSLQYLKHNKGKDGFNISMNKAKLLSILLKIIKLYGLSETTKVDEKNQETYFLPAASKKEKVTSHRKYILGAVLGALGLSAIGGGVMYNYFSSQNKNVAPNNVAITPEIIAMITKQVQEKTKQNNEKLKSAVAPIQTKVPTPTQEIEIEKEELPIVETIIETDPLLGKFPARMTQFHFGEAMIPYNTLKSTYTFSHIKETSSNKVLKSIINTLETSPNWKMNQWRIKKSLQTLDTRNDQNIGLNVFYKNVFVQANNISINKASFNNKSYLIYIDKKTESFALLEKEIMNNVLKSVDTYKFIAFIPGIHRDFVEKALTER